MIEHVVLFKVKAGTHAASVKAMVEGLKGLKTRVPGIVDLSVGANFTDRNKGFTHGLIVRFQDKAALEGYLPHPAHQEVVQGCIRPIIEDVIALDYEV
ncbi:MAG: Dabb family protein [Planctomycetes bacterium]|nr:Dabb family protein [Planctomycetota bacterium]